MPCKNTSNFRKLTLKHLSFVIVLSGPLTSNSSEFNNLCGKKKSVQSKHACDSGEKYKIFNIGLKVSMSLKANALPLCWRADNTDFVFVSKHKNN